MKVLLVSTYELGHQPLAVAAPAALLRERGHDVRCTDLAVDRWDPTLGEWAERVAIAVPMHTAARLARRLAGEVAAPVCCFGLYASMCADVADRVLAGEVDHALVRWVEGADPGSAVQLGRGAATAAPLPARDLLPPLERYARLLAGGHELPVAYVEASHGCAHHCRHCPVPVVYGGRIRIVEPERVLGDVEQQVRQGARHVTFGDPDFFNGVHHSLRVVRAVHAAFPDLTFDCTVKVTHVLRHADVWPELAAAGCLFVVSAFESTDDAVLRRLDKGHTVADERRAIAVLREHRIEPRPTFLPFHPWTTLRSVHDLLDLVAAEDLVANVDPVQYTIRLLLPRGSLLLDDPDLAPVLGGWDTAALSYRWHAADPALDALQADLASLVERDAAAGAPAHETYARVRARVGLDAIHLETPPDRPRLSEPWFCCAEPTTAQLGAL